MLAALKCCTRMRCITFSGSASDFDKLFEGTKCPFPILEDLEICNDAIAELKLLATFLMSQLRTSDVSDCTAFPSYP